jgi:hypothetical protein
MSVRDQNVGGVKNRLPAIPPWARNARHALCLRTDACSLCWRQTRVDAGLCSCCCGSIGCRQKELKLCEVEAGSQILYCYWLQRESEISKQIEKWHGSDHQNDDDGCLILSKLLVKLQHQVHIKVLLLRWEQCTYLLSKLHVSDIFNIWV